MLKLLLIVPLLFASFSPLHADEEKEITSSYLEAKIERLKDMNNQINRYINQRDEVSKKIKNSRSKRLRKERHQLNQQIDKTQKELVYFAANLDVSKTDEQEQNNKKRDLLEEVKVLLAPLLSSLRRLSERPRQIQELRDEKEDEERLLEKYNAAEKEIQALFKTDLPPSLKNNLKNGLKAFEEKKEDIAVRIAQTEQKLVQKLKNDESSFSKSISAIRSFLGVIGRDLFIALLCFTVSLWGLGNIRRRIFRSQLFKKEMISEFQRPLFSIYGILAVVTSLFISLVSLYILDNWLLVTLILLLITSALWSFKHLAPRFLAELKLLFNLGPVREGQRIIWKGIPWKVLRIGMFSTLHNEDLNQMVRVAVKEIIDLHSRPTLYNEVWFPTRKGDFVLLDDGLAEVELQSMEQVQLKMPGNERKIIAATEFINMKLVNLSKDFRLDFTFGLDYAHQADITQKIPETVEVALREKIKDFLKEESKFLKTIEVRFSSAGASSLDLWVRLDCHGALAYKYEILRRFAQAALVDICNKENYIIPFTQLNLHIANKNTEGVLNELS